MFCYKCGAEISPDWKLCPKCGAKLNVEAKAPKKPATKEDVDDALRIWAAPAAVSLVGWMLASFVVMLFTLLLVRSGRVYEGTDLTLFIGLIFFTLAGCALLSALKGKKSSPFPAVTAGILTFFVSLYLFSVYTYLGVGMLAGLLASVLVGLLARVRNPLIHLIAAALPLVLAFLLTMAGIVFLLPDFLFGIAGVFLGISLSLSLLLPAFSYAFPAKKRGS